MENCSLQNYTLSINENNNVITLLIKTNNDIIIKKKLYIQKIGTKNTHLTDGGDLFLPDIYNQFILSLKNDKSTYYNIYTWNGHDKIIYDNDIKQFTLSIASYSDNMTFTIKLIDIERVQFAEELSKITLLMEK